MWVLPVRLADSPLSKSGYFLHHVAPKFILPLGQSFLIADDFLSTQPPIRGDRDKAKVHVGRLLIHMHHGRNIGFGILLGFHELYRIVEEFFYLLPALLLKEFRAGGNQYFYVGNTVLPNTASGVADDPVGNITVLSLGDHGMEVVLTQFHLDIRIAGIGFFGSLIMRFDAAHSGAFILGKAQNCMLCFIHNQFSPFFFQTISYPNTSASSRVSL